MNRTAQINVGISRPRAFGISGLGKINKITEKYTFTRDTTFILGNPLGEENPAKLPYHK
jgi:hypothetical protein